MADWVKPLFETIDRKDAEGFVTFLTDDVRFRFGNGPIAKGREAVQESVETFFESINGLHHDIIDVWEVGDTVITELEVTYRRLDDETVTIPAVNLLHTEGDLIADYRIFIDLAPLYA